MFTVKFKIHSSQFFITMNYSEELIVMILKDRPRYLAFIAILLKGVLKGG